MMDDIFNEFPIGMRCSVGVPVLGNPAGSPAVIYEHYRIGERRGVSLLFPNGNYDGFSSESLQIFDVQPKGLIRSCADYQFTNVIRLRDDFNRGLFEQAFTQ
jgi:hypothetical protein